MDNKKTMEDFIQSCLQLGKELLDKDNLTEAEENFLEKLNLIIDNMKQI